jgi:hypothetical protein
MKPVFQRVETHLRRDRSIRAFFAGHRTEISVGIEAKRGVGLIADAF